MSTLIVSRKVAAAAGLNKYFTGKECKNGHLAERYTASGSCSQCINGISLQQRYRDPKTLNDMATRIETTALSDYNANMQRITKVYEEELAKAAEMRQQAKENELEVLPNIRTVSDTLKGELSKLVTVWIPYKPETREEEEAYHLSLLQKRCPEFTLADLRYRNRNKAGKFFEIRCYPEDMNLIASKYVFHANHTSIV